MLHYFSKTNSIQRLPRYSVPLFAESRTEKKFVRGVICCINWSFHFSIARNFYIIHHRIWPYLLKVPFLLRLSNWLHTTFCTLQLKKNPQQWVLNEDWPTSSDTITICSTMQMYTEMQKRWRAELQQRALEENNSDCNQNCYRKYQSLQYFHCLWSQHRKGRARAEYFAGLYFIWL